MRLVDLKGLFTPQAVATALKAMTPIKTTVIDKVVMTMEMEKKVLFKTGGSR